MRSLPWLLLINYALLHHSAFPITIGGFDGARAGDLSLRDGTIVHITPTQASISAAFPSATITAANTLTSSYLNTLDVVPGLDHRSPPAVVQIPLQFDPQGTVVPHRPKAAVDLGRLEHKSAPLGQRHQRFHVCQVGHCTPGRNRRVRKA